MSYVARRKLNCQQLENALGTPLPTVIMVYATLRDAKLAGAVGSPWDATAPGPEFWTQSSSDRPHWNEVLDALQEHVNFCEEGETTIARDGAIAIPGVFYSADDGPEATVEENEVPHILLQARPAFRHPGYRAVRQELNAAQKSRGFFGSRRGAGGREQRPRMMRSSIQQLKMRTRCARCRELGHWARECPEGNREQRHDERYDQHAWRRGEKLKRFIAVAGQTERKPFILVASWTFVTLEPGEVLWDTGAEENRRETAARSTGKLHAEYGLQVEWSIEKPESASGIGSETQPIGVAYVLVELAGCNGIIRFTVVEQDVPPPLPRTFQAKLDLDDNGDKVIFRQFGGGSLLRTLKSGHTAIRADQFDPDGWQLPETAKLRQNNDQGFVTNYMSAIAHLHQRPRCTNDNTPAGDYDASSTRGYRPQHKTSSDGNGTSRSHPTNLPTPSSRLKSDKQMNRTFQNHERDLCTSHRGDQLRGDSTARNIVDRQTVETSRTLLAVRAMCGILRHTGSGVPDVDSHGTTRGYLAGIAATGATRDEEQKEQCSEPPGGSVGAWQSPTEKQPRNPVEEGTGRMRSSTECNPKGRQRGDVIRTMRGLRESVAAHPPDHGGTGLEDDSKQPHSSLVHWETTGRDRTPFVSTWTREHDDGGHASAESPLGMLNMHYNKQGTDATFAWWTRRDSRMTTSTWFSLGKTRPRVSESAGAAETRGPRDLPPVDL